MDIGERLTRIETLLEELRHYLLGDGNPGKVCTLEIRLRSLEKFRWMCGGAITVLGLAVGAGFMFRFVVR